MATLKELREKQARIATNARARFDEINDSTPAERAAEIEREFDAMMADHDKIGAQIDRLEKLERAERSINAPDPRRPNFDGEARGVDEGQKPSYRHVFAKVVCGMEADLTAEERAVLRGGATEFRAQTAGTTTAGGFTVPTELSNILIRAMRAWGPMYDEDICTVITTTGGNPIRIPYVDDTSSTAGGHTEAAALADTGAKDVTFAQRSLDAFGFDTEFIRWSWELGQDSIVNMEELLGSLLGERLGRIANAQLTTGTGTNAPNGIVTAATLGRTAASATAIVSDDLIDLIHSVDPAYRSSPKVRFMLHDSILQVIRKLKDGQGNYLWQMGNFTAGVPDRILGYPYSINQGMAASMAAGARIVAFGDFGKYYVRKVGAPVIGVMRERFWPDLGIAGLIRFDGELGDANAVKYLRNA